MKKLMLLLLMVVSLAHAEYIDLKGGQVTSQPQKCVHDNGQLYVCIPVVKDGKEYMVLHDLKGEAMIYQIVNNGVVLLWAREGA